MSERKLSPGPWVVLEPYTNRSAFPIAYQQGEVSHIIAEVVPARRPAPGRLPRLMRLAFLLLVVILGRYGLADLAAHLYRRRKRKS